MLVHILRSGANAGEEPSMQTYEVPAEIGWTVMDILDYIQQNLDCTLAYFRHSICDHGICARCAMRINGKVGLACVTPLEEEWELTLEPKSNKVVRDLVTE